MKTTKSRLFNIVIACSLVVNLTAISALCYITSMNSRTDRIIASLSEPVLIYVPKAAAGSPSAALVENAVVK